MKKRLLKKRLRDLQDEDLFDLYYDKRIGRRMSYMVNQEMNLRFEMVTTTVEIKFPNKQTSADRVMSMWQWLQLAPENVHNDNACNALKEYDSTVDALPVSPYKYMQEVAQKYGVHIGEMKEHWQCIPDER
ncbi:hypothetical protein [Staphylococcus aureus]|uniref:hypothetical protein n=1 Tax=Staphylococcus aureus TaxID=1280 RepID=UPI0020C00054|nr:hypothetical protein [Staphylococcus aureus]